MNILKLHIVLLMDQYHKVTDVAAALQLKQPTVTFHMKSLEKEFGCSLFLSQQGRILLTDAGKALLPYAKQMVSLEKAARKAIDDQSTKANESIRIGAESISGTYLLPDWIAGFTSSYPQTHVQLDIHSSSEALLKQLAHNEIDIAFMNGPSNPSEPFIAARVFTDQIGVITASDYVGASSDTITMEEVGELSWVQYHEPSFLHALLKDWSEQHHIKLQVHTSSNSLEANKRIVAAGQAASFFPAVGMKGDQSPSSLRWLSLPVSVAVDYSIQIIQSPNRSLPLAGQAFWNYVTDHSNV